MLEDTNSHDGAQLMLWLFWSFEEYGFTTLFAIILAPIWHNPTYNHIVQILE